MTHDRAVHSDWENAMHAWKIGLVGAALGAVSIITMGAVIYHGSGTSEHAATTRAVHDRNSQSIIALTAPITPAQSSAGTAAERDYGWGPFHTVDW